MLPSLSGSPSARRCGPAPPGRGSSGQRCRGVRPRSSSSPRGSRGYVRTARWSRRRPPQLGVIKLLLDGILREQAAVQIRELAELGIVLPLSQQIEEQRVVEVRVHVTVLIHDARVVVVEVLGIVVQQILLLNEVEENHPVEQDLYISPLGVAPVVGNSADLLHEVGPGIRTARRTP